MILREDRAKSVQRMIVVLTFDPVGAVVRV